MKKVILFITIFSFAIVSCLKEKAEEISAINAPCNETISYNNEIAPEILNMSCNVANCHDATTVAGGYNFSTYDEVKNKADQIFSAISHKNGTLAMPIGSPKLSDSLQNKFRCWIKQGKLDN